MSDPLLTRLSMLLLGVLAGCQGCSKSPPAAKESPAKVTAVPHEENLADVHLTEKAFERLGIVTAPVIRQRVSEFRILAGEITVPPGKQATVVAPVAGTIELPDGGELPPPGSLVERGQILFRFVPLLTPERFVPTPAERAQIAMARASVISLQMAADADVRQFQEQAALARIALDRAGQLQQDRVGSQRAVDEANAQLAIAEAALKVARERKRVLDGFSSDLERDNASPLPIASPIQGVLRTLPVVVGQTVSAGTALFEVVDLETLWVRVPVYVGLLHDLQLQESVAISLFGEEGEPSSLRARPIEAPPAADPLSSTADLYYVLESAGTRFRPGERVSVSIPWNGQSESLVVPSESILYDIHGNTWVYTALERRHFRRARVEIERTVGKSAVLFRGPPAGTEVVIAGAAELFGTEFGTGK